MQPGYNPETPVNSTTSAITFAPNTSRTQKQIRYDAILAEFMAAKEGVPDKLGNKPMTMMSSTAGPKSEAPRTLNSEAPMVTEEVAEENSTTIYSPGNFNNLQSIELDMVGKIDGTTPQNTTNRLFRSSMLNDSNGKIRNSQSAMLTVGARSGVLGNRGLVQTNRGLLNTSPASASSVNLRIPGAFSGYQGPSGLITNSQPKLNPGRVQDGRTTNVAGPFTQVFGESSLVHSMASIIEGPLRIHGGMGPISLPNLQSEQDRYVLTWEVNRIEFNFFQSLENCRLAKN